MPQCSAVAFRVASWLLVRCLSLVVRRRALMPDRSEVEAVPREFVPVDFADAFIRVHPWHPCSNWMRSRLCQLQRQWRLIPVAHLFRSARKQ